MASQCFQDVPQKRTRSGEITEIRIGSLEPVSPGAAPLGCFRPSTTRLLRLSLLDPGSSLSIGQFSSALVTTLEVHTRTQQKFNAKSPELL